MIRTVIYSIFISLIFSSCSPHMSAFESKAGKKEKTRVSEHYFTEGMKFYILNDYPQAESWFRKSLEISPDNAALNYMLAKIQIDKKDMSQALFYIEKALKNSDKNEYYYQLQADIYRDMGNLEDATKVYQKMTTVFPESEENYLNLASLLLYQKQTEEALKIYDQVEKKFGKSPDLSRQKQQLYVRLNNEEAALNEAKMLAESYPDDISLQLSYVELLIDYNHKDEAGKFLKTIREKDPENPYASFILANLAREKGDENLYFNLMVEVFESPEMSLDTKLSILRDLKETHQKKKETRKQVGRLSAAMVEAHPDNPDAYIAVGEILLENNDKEGAWKQFLKAKDLDDTDYNLWYKLIILDSELNKVDSMVRHSEQALEIYPNQAAIWYLNGSAYLRNDKIDDAIASLEHGSRIASGNDQLAFQFYVMLGDAYHNAAEFSKSDEAFDQALKIEPNNPHILNNYSYFLSLRNEKLPQALEMAEKLMGIAPENAAYLDTYAWVLYKLKRFDEAKLFLEKAIKNSNDGTIVEHFGDVLFQLGMKDEAVNEWMKARKLGQTSDKINKKIADKNLYE